MKRLASIVLCAVVLLGCEREIPTVEVTYSIFENSADNPTFSIEYTNDQWGGSVIGSNNDNYWTSGKLVLKQGQFVSLKATCNEPVYDLQLFIFVNGNQWKSVSMANPTSTVTLSGELPAE